MLSSFFFSAPTVPAQPDAVSGVPFKDRRVEGRKFRCLERFISAEELLNKIDKNNFLQNRSNHRILHAVNGEKRKMEICKTDSARVYKPATMGYSNAYF